MGKYSSSDYDEERAEMEAQMKKEELKRIEDEQGLVKKAEIETEFQEYIDRISLIASEDDLEKLRAMKLHEKKVIVADQNQSAGKMFLRLIARRGWHKLPGGAKKV